ncbi:hypothetical protein BBK36DRAFT_1108174 [Trichoderma citrinoviride]|uniref:2EXR domain-containing protein n=1 Tax=Trichoderma citrinoviride TaxID=58853 RepID=A0A2T4BM13_9HYPO|nr:hypothetical protein BBK36DRAFT_1108174 [Trichoderma citrinoviride]PTB70348.1 hypothetical protein BBK36DRAFT_1108174 [Trichoderma citrinoviride]
MDTSYCLLEAAPSRCFDSQTSPARNINDIQDVLERAQRVQFIQEQQIKELERQLLALRREGASEFPFFSRLPPELRCRIWKLALPVQIFRPFRFLQPSFLEWKTLSPPTISAVCREARYVAYQNGALYSHEFLAPLSWTWFNGHTDILDLSPFRMKKDSSFIPLQKKLLQETRAVMLDVETVDSLLLTGLFGEDRQLPNICVIHLMAGNTFQVDKQSWHPHAVARLFGGQSFVHVDIEDDQEVAQLDQLLLAAMSGADGSFMSKWEKDAITKLQAQVRPSTDKLEQWKKAKQLIMQGWISHNSEASPRDIPKSCIGGNGMIKEAEVRKLYPGMPVIKLVQTFELAPMPQLEKWYKDCGRQMMEDVRG